LRFPATFIAVDGPLVHHGVVRRSLSALLLLTLTCSCSKAALDYGVDEPVADGDGDGGDGDGDGDQGDGDDGDDEDEDEGDSDHRYELCTGGGDVRLGLVSAGGFVDTFFDYTNPYGHRFLYVTGDCEFLSGASLLGEVRTGTLAKPQARKLEDDLDLDAVNRWPPYRDESCPDASTAYVKTTSGYGECSCGCDPSGPEGVADTIGLADAVWDAFAARGERLTGPVEVMAIELEESDPSRTAQIWPLAYDLQLIAVRLEEYYMGFEPTVDMFEEYEAEVLREMRSVTAPTSWQPTTYVESGGIYYDLYIRDQVPDHLAEAIDRFGAP
jgi:hypothetical protein